MVFCVESLELKQNQDVVGLNHPLESKTDLWLVADHVVKNRHERGVKRLKLVHYVAVTGKVEEFKPKMFRDMWVDCL